MLKFLFLLTILISFTTGATVINAVKLNTYTFSDDLDFDNMELAINRQMNAFSKNSLTKIKIAGKLYSNYDLRFTLNKFLLLIQNFQKCNLPKAECWEDFNKQLQLKFTFYKIQANTNETGYGKEKQSHFTAYYSPDLDASLSPSSEYPNTIYSKPTNSTDLNFTREQIDFDYSLQNKNLDVAYIKNPLFDIWLLHVEGGGRLNLKDSNGIPYYKYLSYAGTNKKKFNMLYKYMLKTGMLKKGHTSIANQRAFLEANPDKQREVFASCPSYVFFKVTDDEPIGINDIILTPNRSIATDYRLVKHYGLLYFLDLVSPIAGNQNHIHKQFHINQDTGGAIKGVARADIYFGFGKDAEFSANNTNTHGDQIIILHK